MLISVDEVGRVIAEMTRSFEGRESAISIMEASGNQFENWWKGALLIEFTKAPWNRLPGRRPSRQSGVGVGMEGTWPLADERMQYAKRKKAAGQRAQNRVDLEIRSSPTGERFHLVELKLLDRKKDGWPVKDQLRAIETDIRGLYSVNWPEVASGWSVVLGLRCRSRTDFEDLLEEGVDGLGFPVFRVATYEISEAVWLGARRVI